LISSQRESSQQSFVCNQKEVALKLIFYFNNDWHVLNHIETCQAYKQDLAGKEKN